MSNFIKYGIIGEGTMGHEHIKNDQKTLHNHEFPFKKYDHLYIHVSLLEK